MTHKETLAVQLEKNTTTFEFLEQNLHTNDPFVFQGNHPNISNEIKKTKRLLDQIREKSKNDPKRYIENFITGLIQIAYLYQEKGKFDKAITSFQEALKNIRLLNKLSNNKYAISEIRLQYSLGTLYPYIGKIRRARRFLLNAKKKTEQIIGRKDLPSIELLIYLEGLGDFYQQINRIGLSRVYYSKCLELIKSQKEKDANIIRQQIILLYKLSSIESIKNNIKDAYPYCMEAISLLDHLKTSKSDTTEIRLSINTLYIQLQLQSGDIESAMHNLIDSETFLNNTPLEIKSHHLLAFGKLAQELGDYFMLANMMDNATAFYHKATQFYQESPHYNHDTMMEHSSILNNLAAIYMDNLELEKVEKLIFKSLEIRKTLFEKDPEEQVLDYAGTLINLAIFYTDTKMDKETPRNLIQESLNLLSKYDPEVYDMDEEKYAQIMTKTLMTLDLLEKNK